ncbi:polysaccharide biosynthesis tyrosine autokinase [Porphyromonas macacae]|nr:polysaccharide biosynthesis tyrosine autokinase [Porphyromonas macacae]
MDKNLIAQKTDDFINERIKIIAYGLGDAETALEQTKKAAGLTNLSDFQNVVSGNASAEKERVQINTQLQLVKYLREYVYNPQNNDQVIPANIGIENTTLTTLISNYNEQLLKRNRYLESSTPENPMVVRKTEELKTLKENILTSINNVYQSLLINKRDIDTHASKLAGRILNAPTQERELTDISRQQEIKSSLYLMLLQKREENNIKLASTADNARIIDPAIASRKPVNPNPFTVRLIALILGILIPVIILLLLNFFKTKISSVEDIRKLTAIPIFAQVPWIKDLKKLQIVIKEKDNTPLSEVFRKIRTNLRLALKRENNKVVLVTSTVKGEGKTFIASNLAASLSLLGKKVVIIGMDMRNPQLINVFGLKEQSAGLSDMLLAGNRNYDSYIQTSTYHDNLFILPAGKNSVNSTELLELPLLQEIVKELKMKFDFVIIDTVSVGEDVVDAFVISDLADATLYVCRDNHVKRDQFSTVNELISQGILQNVSIVFNG